MKRKTRFDDGGMAEDDLEKADRRFRQEQAEANQGMYDKEPGWESADTGMYEKEPGWSSKSAAPRAAPRATAPALKNVPGSGRGSMAGRTASDVNTYHERAGEIPGTASRSLKNTKTTAEKVSDEVYENTMKALVATGAAGLGAAGLAKLKKMADARRLLNKEAAQRFSAPQARQVGEKTTARPSQASKERAEAMEKAKPILQSRPETKSARASRTRRSEEDSGIEFSRGGSTASRRADGCAQRGKTRGKMY